jgi:hypothetical protein
MAKQVINGAGFEYCTASALLNQYRADNRQLILPNDQQEAFYSRKAKFDLIKIETALQQQKAAAAFAKHLAEGDAKGFRDVYKGGKAYNLLVGDDPRAGDVSDLTIVGAGKRLGISLKWNSDEIKGPRMGRYWFKKFHLHDDGLWESQVRSLNQKLAQYQTWREATEALGRETIYGTYRDAAIAVLSQNLRNKKFVRSFSVFNFGSKDYIKVMAMRSGSKLKMGWYDTSKLPTEVVRIIPSDKGPGYFEVLFNNWLLLFRLHNGDTQIKPCSVGSGMKISVTVESWAGKEPEVIKVD